MRLWAGFTLPPWYLFKVRPLYWLRPRVSFEWLRERGGLRAAVAIRALGLFLVLSGDDRIRGAGADTAADVTGDGDVLLTLLQSCKEVGAKS